MPRRKLSADVAAQLSEPWVSPRTGREISSAQARRYAVAGISRTEYESGARVSEARGHRNEHAERERRARGIYNDPIIRAASRRGLNEEIPLLTEFSREQQREAAAAYLAAFMPDEFRRSKVLDAFRAANPGKGDAFGRYAELLDFMQNPPSGFEGLESTDTAEAWDRARKNYNLHIGFILHGSDWKPSDRTRTKK